MVNMPSISSAFDTERVTATELDSHADSPVVGRYSRILEYTGRKASVAGFTKDLGKPMTVPVVNAAVAYDCEVSGETRILVICNALYFKNMEVNLIPPFMMRLAGIEVDECPKFLASAPSESNHSMFFRDDNIRIPFHLEGIVSYIPTRIPTEDELVSKEGKYLLMTPNLPTWDPHTEMFRDQELSMMDYKGNVKEKARHFKTEDSMFWNDAEPQEMEVDNLISSIRILGESIISGVKSVHRKGRVTAASLAQKLQIPIEMAKKTIQATTQLAVRTVNEPSLTRKFSSNDRMLRYSRLATDTFMDTMFASAKIGPSQRGFTSCQVFATEFGHVFVVPMSSKKGIEIAQAIKRYFKEIGVPEHLVCDQAREQVKGEARILCNEAGCHVVELEKGTPASNRAEKAIKILKDGAKRDLFQSDSPMVFWCYCVERRADIINATVRSNYLLQGQTPYTKLTGQPTDISSICEFGWYEWVIYRVEGQKFPLQHQRLGRVLGIARHAGNMMSKWVLTASGEVMPIQTLRSLTPAENNNPTIKERKKAFDLFIRSKFGDSASPPPGPSNEPYPELTWNQRILPAEKTCMNHMKVYMVKEPQL